MDVPAWPEGGAAPPGETSEGDRGADGASVVEVDRDGTMRARGSTVCACWACCLWQISERGGKGGRLRLVMNSAQTLTSFLLLPFLRRMAASSHDPLDSLNHLESSFFQTGYRGGFAHGALHGLFEGRSIGKEKGFELWEEVGYYEGVAGLWRLVLDRPDGSAKGKRALAHLDTLISLIALFPTQNSSDAVASSTPSDSSPPAFPTEDPPPQLDAHGKETDIASLLERIRARYKLVCSTLGVRPRLTQVRVQDDDGDDDMAGEPSSGVDQPGEQQLEKGQVVVNGQQISSKQLLF